MNRLQELVDQLYHWYIECSQPASVGADGSAFYRGSSGERGGLGLFIEESQYDAQMEMLPADFLVAQYPGLRRNFQGVSAQQLYMLQKLHDDSARMARTPMGPSRPATNEEFRLNFASRLRDFCDAYGLVFPGNAVTA